MEIYSEEELSRILNNSQKIIIVELMDMNDEFQNKLHFDINNFILKNLNREILLLKINKNFYNKIFEQFDKYPSFIVFKNNKQIKYSSEILSLGDFEVFVKSLL